jgi:UDP-GlcNAc:undecaprenyl-phosphate GlcNAc-1-phosphate transferase
MMFRDFAGPERPLSWSLQFWPVLVCSFVAALAATWLCKKIALKLGIVDTPDNHVKTHKEPVAYLGGVGILVGLTVGILGGIVLLKDTEGFDQSLTWLLGILTGAGIACFVGLVDDLMDIRPWQKLLGQFVAAFGLILVGILPNLNLFFEPFNIELSETLGSILGFFVVAFFVLGATNSLNLLDGLDGLCGGVTAIITLAMLILSIHLATWDTSDVAVPVRIIICLGMVGGVLGFLPMRAACCWVFWLLR